MEAIVIRLVCRNVYKPVGMNLRRANLVIVKVLSDDEVQFVN